MKLVLIDVHSPVQTCKRVCCIYTPLPHTHKRNKLQTLYDKMICKILKLKIPIMSITKKSFCHFNCAPAEKMYLFIAIQKRSQLKSTQI